MGNFNEISIVSVTLLDTYKEDKNGNLPILLRPVAGKIPTQRTISGTVGSREGLLPGRMYMVRSEETEADETYGRQFRFEKLSEVSPLELVQSMGTLGKGVVIDTSNDADEAAAVIDAAVPSTTKAPKSKATAQIEE